MFLFEMSLVQHVNTFLKNYLELTFRNSQLFRGLFPIILAEQPVRSQSSKTRYIVWKRGATVANSLSYSGWSSDLTHAMCTSLLPILSKNHQYRHILWVIYHPKFEKFFQHCQRMICDKTTVFNWAAQKYSANHPTGLSEVHMACVRSELQPPYIKEWATFAPRFHTIYLVLLDYHRLSANFVKKITISFEQFLVQFQ